VRSLYLLGLAYLAVSLFALWRGPITAQGGGNVYTGAAASDGAAWFTQVKPSCNALEVETVQRAYPAPNTLDGTGYAAACWALAGRIDDARQVISRLAPGDRWRAAGIVFDIGHPIADMGDDRSAGPIMELVVEFWPNHYMALYHAGAARFSLGDMAAAEEHLREFLLYYHADDSWTGNARTMLAEIARR